MPNGIKYTTGSVETGCLKKGNMLIANNTADYGSSFYSGITPPAGGYTVYLNKATGGPSIYCPANDSQLISLTNSISGQNFLTVAAALDWYNGQSDKLVLNRDYPGIVTNGLVACLDAGFTPSYPTTGTTWYDLSGNGNHFTLYNGVGYNSASGGSLVFDGSNDYCRSQSTIDLSASVGVTVQVIGKSSNIGMLYENSNDWNNNPGGFGLSANADGYIYTNQMMHFYWNTNGGTSTGARNFSPYDQSTFFVESKTLIKNNSDGLQDYFNGTRVSYAASYWGSGTSTVGNTTNFRNDYFYIGSRAGTTSFVNGNIAGFLVYNRPLSSAEVTQNFNAYKTRFGL